MVETLLPSCAWRLADLELVPRLGVRVMSTFACGGGSSLGYKLAGCDVIAANDIDPEMAWHYQANLHPRHYFLGPIRDLIDKPLPAELDDLDILDGSPPCSTFSLAGNREEDWGKSKRFREGQATQVLSDLFIDYLDLVARLRPKVAVAENVAGMLVGNAKGYVRLIVERFRAIGYRVQVFVLQATDCGVPQRRKRVFFCALRDDLAALPLVLRPRHRPISSGEACADLQDLTADEIAGTKPCATDRIWWHRTPKGGSYADAVALTTGKTSLFNFTRLDDRQPSPTLTGQWQVILHWGQCRRLTWREYCRLGSFPDDYQAKTPALGRYLVGMSVPPRLAETVARAVCRQWLGRDVPESEGREGA